MATRTGVGFSDNSESQKAGMGAASAAMAQAGLSRCDLAILYSTSRHDPARLRDGVRSVIGPEARLIGGYSSGIITADELGYDGYQVGVAVLSSDTVKVDMFIEGGLVRNEFDVGVMLGDQIQAKEYVGTPNLLLMYDFVRAKPPEGMSWNINWGSRLIEGMGHSLGTWPPAAGFGMMGDWQCNPTYQWFHDRIEQHTAMALVLSGGVRMDTIIMHGTKPSSGYHTITQAEENLVLEIDGKPAIEVMANLLGPESFQSWVDYPFFVTFGVNRGDKFGQFREEDKERGALIMFEPDLTEGTEVQLMRRDFTDFDYVRGYAEEVLARVGDRQPFFAFYIDCAGRGGAYSGTEGEEAEEVQRVIGSRMPLLGVYTGTEMAKVGGRMQAMVWTGVLSVFSE
jgi:hypothetical protein